MASEIFVLGLQDFSGCFYLLGSTELIVGKEKELYFVLFLSHTRFTVVAREISDVFSYVLAFLRYPSH